MGLQVIDLRTAPERIYLLEDRRSRCRWQVKASAEPVQHVADYTLHLLATALGAYLCGAPHDGITVDLVVPPFGRPSAEVDVEYRLTVGSEPVVATLAITAWIDAALDGDVSTWQVVEAHKHDIARCMAALAYATLTEF